MFQTGGLGRERPGGRRRVLRHRGSDPFPWRARPSRLRRGHDGIRGALAEGLFESSLTGAAGNKAWGVLSNVAHVFFCFVGTKPEASTPGGVEGEEPLPFCVTTDWVFYRAEVL